jgi:hypothetical protein
LSNKLADAFDDLHVEGADLLSFAQGKHELAKNPALYTQVCV